MRRGLPPWRKAHKLAEIRTPEAEDGGKSENKIMPFYIIKFGLLVEQLGINDLLMYSYLLSNLREIFCRGQEAQDSSFPAWVTEI